MPESHPLRLNEKVDRAILLIRGQRVMIDSDIAEIYDVPTKVLNQAVQRNLERFPSDFMFQLTQGEKTKVVTDCDHLNKLKYSPYLPYAFTEHGAIMLASVLNSAVAINASIQIVRAFVRLRNLLLSNKELAQKLSELENKYDKQFRIVFAALKELINKASLPRNPIGFEIKKKPK